MKTFVVFVATTFLILSPYSLSAQEETVADYEFGEGIIALSLEDEDAAREHLRAASSINAEIILNLLDSPTHAAQSEFDYSDPTLVEYYRYIIEVARNPKYPFFTDILRELKARDLNKDLSEMGSFQYACFSPKSTYFIVYCSKKTMLLESDGGCTIQVFDNDFDQEVVEPYIFISEKEKFLLKYRIIEYEDINRYLITFENIASKKLKWVKEIEGDIYMNFSKGYSKVVLLVYNVGKNLEDVYLVTLDASNGVEISRKDLGVIGWESAFSVFEGLTIPVSDAGDISNESVTVRSPDNKYLLAGNRKNGKLTLRELQSNRVIREFGFKAQGE